MEQLPVSFSSADLIGNAVGFTPSISTIFAIADANFCAERRAAEIGPRTGIYVLLGRDNWTGFPSPENSASERQLIRSSYRANNNPVLNDNKKKSSSRNWDDIAIGILRSVDHAIDSRRAKQ